MEVVGALAAGVVFIAVMSGIPEPLRQQFNAVFVGGAGAAYLSAGTGPFGLGELVFATVVASAATAGLRSYRWIGVAWMLHVGWDVLHHAAEAPILALDPWSSAGCAICDTVIAMWFWVGAPSVWRLPSK